MRFKDLTWRQIGYVFFWSLGLFAATFYCIFDQANETVKIVFGKMTVIYAMDLAKSYLFPLFMAMALFLLDVRHETVIHKQQFTFDFSKNFITCFVVFAFAITFSILFNTVFWGWFFFVVSWLALSSLKLFTLMEVETCGIEIDRG